MNELTSSQTWHFVFGKLDAVDSVVNSCFGIVGQTNNFQKRNIREGKRRYTPVDSFRKHRFYFEFIRLVY